MKKETMDSVKSALESGYIHHQMGVSCLLSGEKSITQIWAQENHQPTYPQINRLFTLKPKV